MRFNPENYVDVQERINTFWKEWPQGSIQTEMLTDGAQFDAVVIKATVYRFAEDMQPAATGIASEVRGDNFKDGANFTSWHENCETSAIGRALANMGYAKNRTDRPSRQEMQKVERAQQAPQPRTVNEIAGGPPMNGNGNDYPQRPTPQQVNQAQMLDPNAPATDRQKEFIIGLAKQLGMVSDNDHHDPQALDAEVRQLTNGGTMQTLTKGQASLVIEEFKARPKPVAR